jgi:hypothetical protein
MVQHTVDLGLGKEEFDEPTTYLVIGQGFGIGDLYAPFLFM